MTGFAAHWNRRHGVDPILQESNEVRERGKTRPHDYVFLIDIDLRDGFSTFETVQRYVL